MQRRNLRRRSAPTTTIFLRHSAPLVLSFPHSSYLLFLSLRLSYSLPLTLFLSFPPPITHSYPRHDYYYHFKTSAPQRFTARIGNHRHSLNKNNSAPYFVPSPSRLLTTALPLNSPFLSFSSSTIFFLLLLLASSLNLFLLGDAHGLLLPSRLFCKVCAVELEGRSEASALLR